MNNQHFSNNELMASLLNNNKNEFLVVAESEIRQNLNIKKLSFRFSEREKI